MDKSQIFVVLIWLSSNLSFIFSSVIMADIYFDSFYTNFVNFP